MSKARTANRPPTKRSPSSSSNPETILGEGEREPLGNVENFLNIDEWRRVPGREKIDDGRSKVFSGQDAAYLSNLAISSRRRHRRIRQVLALRRQRRSASARVVRQDSSSDVVLPLRVLVVHVVAGLAVVPVARVAAREHVLGAAQGALTDVRLRHRCRGRGRCRCGGSLGLWSGRKLDDLVVGVTTVPGERRRRDFRGRRRPTLKMICFPLLLLRLSFDKFQCVLRVNFRRRDAAHVIVSRNRVTRVDVFCCRIT